MGQSAYEVELPMGSRIHNVFYIFVLKKSRGSQHLSLDLPPMAINSHILLEPLSIVDTRVILREGTEVPQVLV